MRGERGAVLAQVLVLAVVACLLCASLLRARMQPALDVARVRDRLADDLAAQGAINRVEEVWTRVGVCASDGLAGVECFGSGAACDCACNVRPFANGAPAARVVSAPLGGSCSLTATRL